MNIFRKMSWFHLFPFLFAAYPIFALSSNNLIYVQYSSFIRSLLIVEAVTLLLYAICTLITRDMSKAGLLTTALLLAFFSYGQLYLVINSHFPDLIRHRYLILLMAILVLAIFILVIKARSPGKLLLQYLTITSIILLAISAYPTIRQGIVNRLAVQKAQQEKELTAIPDGNLIRPDIYLIILDS